MRHKLSAVALRGEAGGTSIVPRRCVCRGRRERKRKRKGGRRKGERKE